MRCPSCGEDNPERAKFCLECGSALTTAPPAGSGESRRTVTVVFADMVGFTSLGESLDQESLRRVMDRFYAEMRGAIEAEQGTLAKFIGDAVLAVWGTPEVREDDALRAVRAADAMRRALSGLNEDLGERWGVRVGMRTGVNTGEVVVDPSRPADLLVGDTLNVAARLEQAAADGEVLVGPDTFRLVRDHTILEPVAPLALKGKARPMPAWRVVDARTGEPRQVARLQAPLVGREDELAVLRAALDEVLVARACRMITVIGSPGLGKTRLVSEFVRSVAGEAVVLHGRCQATGEGITFQPVAEVLRGAAGIEDDDTPEAARTKLGAMLPEDEPDRDRVVERAASLLGLAPAASTEEAFWAVRRVLEALARERPVVLVHDDIHWGQPTFLDLLEHFAEWIRDAPVLVVGLARPELREVRPTMAEGALALTPLGEEASRAMVSGLLGAADLPEGLAQRVLETTEGNPLFLGEMLRMLADEGVLERQGDTWVAGNLTDVTVPPTINALLSSRIQRLEPDERSVVERAAVIGHVFYRGAVTELAPAPVRPQVDEALVTLSRKEMVRPEDEWWLDEQVFRFHHVLIRDAAYRSLLKEARAELHERFAAWLETKAGELAGEHEEVIAFHLEQAHAYRLELGPLNEAGRDLAGRAGRRLHSAGCRALAREDLPAAINLLRRALAPLEADAAARLEVLVDLAEAVLSAGDTGAAEEIVEELGLGAEELGDERLRARAVVFAAQLDNLTGAGHVRETAEAGARAAETLAAAGDRAGEAKAHQVVAQAEALLGQVGAAEAALDRALVAARAADDRRRITAVLSGAPRAALWGPAPIVRASGRCLDVVRILRMTPGNRHVEAAALRSQAVLEAMRGRDEAARGILATCRTTLEELGLTLELHETAVHAGIVEMLSGDAAAAEAHLRSAHDGFRGLGVESGAAQAAALLSGALLAQGRDDEALEATHFAEQHGGEDLKTTATWLGARAEILARRGERDEARALVRRAVELTEPTDALADRADALMALAGVEAAMGDEQAAREAATRARELYAAKDHSVGVARTEVLAGTPGPAPAPAPAASISGDEGPAARALRRWSTCLDEADWEGLGVLFGAESFRWVERRSVGFFDEEGGHELDGPAAVRSMSTISEGASWTFELLADAGDVAAGLIISRGTGRKAGPWEVVAGIVCVCRRGEPVLCEAFEDDRAALLARFEELRPLAPTADGGRCPETVYARLVHGYNSRDWKAVRELLAEDLVVEDTRQVGWDPIHGADAMLEFFRSTIEPGPDIVYGIDRVLARDARAIALTSTHLAHAADSGAEFTIPLGQVAQFDEDGLLERVWFYDHGDEEGMLARFGKLNDDPASCSEILPTCAAAVAAPTSSPARQVARRLPELFNAREWEAVRDLYAPGFTIEDRRPARDWTSEGLDHIAAIRQLTELAPDSRFSSLALGDSEQVTLSRWTWTGTTSEGGEVSDISLIVQTHADDGRFLNGHLFDPEHEAEARAFFEALSKPAEDLRPQRFPALFNARDWSGLRALFAAEWSQEDHRPLGTARYAGFEAIAAAWREVIDMAPDVRAEQRRLWADGDVLCTRIAFTGTRDGGAFENRLIVITVWRAQQIVATEVFADDAPTEVVRARFETLATQERNLAVGHLRRRLAAFAERDWTAMGDAFNPECTYDDRRAAMAHELEGGREGIVGLYRGISKDSTARASASVLATSGDRWCSSRLVISGEGGRTAGPWEVVVCEHLLVDDEGRGLWTEVADEVDAETASRRLLELASAGGEISPVARLYAEVECAFNEGDWDAYAEVLREDYRWADLRPGLRVETHTRDEFVAHLRGMREGKDLRWKQTHLEERADGRVGLARILQTGTYRGGPYEIPFLVINVMDDEGRSFGGEMFADDDPAATERLEELATHHLLSKRLEEAINRRDFEALRDLTAADFRQNDCRPMGAAPVTNRDAYLEAISTVVASIPDVRVRMDVVAVSGEHRLTRSRWSGHAGEGAGALELELWVLSRVVGGVHVQSAVYATETEAAAALSEQAQ